MNDPSLPDMESAHDDNSLEDQQLGPFHLQRLVGTGTATLPTRDRSVGATGTFSDRAPERDHCESDSRQPTGRVTSNGLVSLGFCTHLRPVSMARRANSRRRHRPDGTNRVVIAPPGSRGSGEAIAPWTGRIRSTPQHRQFALKVGQFRIARIDSPGNSQGTLCVDTAALADP